MQPVKFLLLLCIGLALAACAVAPSQVEQAQPHWSGRMTVRVDGLPPQDAQSFSAAFELQGTPEHGQLHLLTPLGSTAAAMRWTPVQALLQADGKTRIFSDVDELIASLMGTPIPVSALFAWLDGQTLALDGWQVDQSQFGNGKIAARRLLPLPQAEIRVVLER